MTLKRGPDGKCVHPGEKEEMPQRKDRVNETPRQGRV